MQTLRRYRYAFTLIIILLFILCSLLLGGWIGGEFSQTPGPARTLGSLTGGVPAQTSGTSGAVASPTSYRPGGRLVIPTIGVDASIEPVGVSSDGNLAVPTQKPWDGVGWYQYGPYPGAQKKKKKGKGVM